MLSGSEISSSVDPIFSYVGLTVNKTDNASIFSASDKAKQKVEELFGTALFEKFGYTYAIDLADNIRDDYDELAKEAVCRTTRFALTKNALRMMTAQVENCR